MLRAAFLTILLGACAGDAARDDSSRAAVATTAQTTAGATAAASGTTAKPACPSTGLWAQCAVVDRLDRAGLAPRLDSIAAPTEAPLTARGFLVRVGNSELEIYVYPTVEARRRDIARVDTMRYLGYTEAVSMQQLPTLIQSANLIAILHSRNDHQRERVGDALTAGPPQRAERGPQQLPPAAPPPSSP